MSFQQKRVENISGKKTDGKDCYQVLHLTLRNNNLLPPTNSFGDVQIATAFSLLKEDVAKEKAKVR